MKPDIHEICRRDLYADRADLAKRYPDNIVEKVIRVRQIHQWMIDTPSIKERDLVAKVIETYGVSKPTAYSDISVVKVLLPQLGRHTRDFMRWRVNEMLLETYEMAKEKGDFKTMERAASSLGKYNRIDAEDSHDLPLEQILVQPFTATDDPSVLGLQRIPDIRGKIKAMVAELSKESGDVRDITYEEADIEEAELFAPLEDPDNGEEDIL